MNEGAAESPLKVEMKSFSETNARLESVAERLRGRLEPCCASTTPTTDKCQEAKSPNCSFHEELRTQINRVDNVISTLCTIEDTLQL
jgi:hypothetical protein